MSTVYEELLSHIIGLEVIDTHEHLPPFEDRRERQTDVLKEYLTHYFVCDLISAGLKRAEHEKVIDYTLPLGERWRIVELYWKECRITGYGRALDESARGLYGIEEINGDTIEELNRKFIASLDQQHFEKVLKEKSKIRTSLLHDVSKENDDIIFTSRLSCDKQFFRNVYPVDRLVYPQSIDDVHRIETETDITVTCFDDWLEAAEMMLRNAFDSGAAACKSGLAYMRSLDYAKVTKHEAETEFNDIFRFTHMNNYLPSAFTLGKKFQDYMMHFVCRYADKNNLTMQFHTGIQEGNGNILPNSNPALLTPLFLQYPNADFDLFHIGYPYQNEIGVLAKNFPNVYIDMCWAHIISPTASINALAEWLDLVPVNKISAFGGDYLFIDGVYGHVMMAKRNVCSSLTRKIEEGVIGVDRAAEIAEQLFFGNPLKLFKLEGPV